ncbi:Protein NATD1 [Oryzias melastigma]|uniref:Protein NATD1 n=1 Tax=Oryzias melastigma TaxID=30732 RepID=A0A834KY46_ORYME|nr:Protein NATD1 [Oryzias melastigma]
MAFKLTSRLRALPRQVRFCRAAFCSSIGSRFQVQHDPHGHRFTLVPSAGTDSEEVAVLLYKFTGEKEVDLMSTFVPETIRGQGAAAVLSQAAMDFLVKEDLKARISCWYIKKYIEEHPEELYKDRVIAYTIQN